MGILDRSFPVHLLTLFRKTSYSRMHRCRDVTLTPVLPMTEVERTLDADC